MFMYIYIYISYLYDIFKCMNKFYIEISLTE